MSLSDSSLDALGILALLILTSLLDVLALNFFMSARNRRKHNKLKLVNEYLARHQLSYPIWYITLILLADIHRLTNHEAVVMKNEMAIATVLSVFFWLGGLNGVAGQDDAILADHPKCETHCSSSWSLRFTVIALSSVLAIRFLWYCDGGGVAPRSHTRTNEVTIGRL
jgi:hypothetical protein